MPEDPPDNRRTIALVALIGVVILFVVELVALVAGQAEIAAGVFVVFVIGWFVLRSWMKRTGHVSR